VPAQRGHYNSRVFAGHFDQRGKTRMTFHQGGDVTVLASAQQITLPMTGDGAVLDFCGPFPDGDSIHDLATAVSTNTRMPRATYPPLGPKVLNQLFFQHSSRLNEQAAIKPAPTVLHISPLDRRPAHRHLAVRELYFRTLGSRTWDLLEAFSVPLYSLHQVEDDLTLDAGLPARFFSRRRRLSFQQVLAHVLIKGDYAATFAAILVATRFLI
jgi:hypothetical protein